MYTEAETLLSCSFFFFFFFFSIPFICAAEQKYNMHQFVCSLQRPSVPVISIIIAASNVICFCLIAATIHITVKAAPCTSLTRSTISMADTTVYVFFLIAFLLFSRKKIAN